MTTDDKFGVKQRGKKNLQKSMPNFWRSIFGAVHSVLIDIEHGVDRHCVFFDHILLQYQLAPYLASISAVFRAFIILYHLMLKMA